MTISEHPWLIPVVLVGMVVVSYVMIRIRTAVTSHPTKKSSRNVVVVTLVPYKEEQYQELEEP